MGKKKRIFQHGCSGNLSNFHRAFHPALLGCWLYLLSGCDCVSNVWLASYLVFDLSLRTTSWHREHVLLSQVCGARNQILKVKRISREHQAGKWQNHDLNNLVGVELLPPPASHVELRIHCSARFSTHLNFCFVGSYTSSKSHHPVSPRG